jgi:hypothetical protein
VVLQVVTGFVAVADFLISSALGWRYLLSRSFRAKVHAGWKGRGKSSVAAEIAWHSACFIVANVLLGIAVLYMYEGCVRLYEGIVAPSDSALLARIAQTPNNRFERSRVASSVSQGGSR